MINGARSRAGHGRVCGGELDMEGGVCMFQNVSLLLVSYTLCLHYILTPDNNICGHESLFVSLFPEPP